MVQPRGLRVPLHYHAGKHQRRDVDPAGTYWYLSASPELLALAAQRLATTSTGRS